ncbi:MAG: DNA repair protein [Bacteroidetes bacterium]|nr:MAG: DNA repair protein [Bacteroidota bacterium]
MQQNSLSPNLAEISVSYSSKIKASERRKISSSKDVEVILREIWTDSTIELREEFYILLLNRANQLLGWSKIATGGLTGTVCDPRIVFSIALKCLACSVILAHNHPSGNTQPSNSDIQLTKNLVAGGKLLEISVLDHLILTKDSVYSFADEGII